MNNLEKALFVSPAAQPPSQLQRRAQGVVDAGLPAIAAGTQGGQHIGVKADLDVRCAYSGPRPPPAHPCLALKQPGSCPV